MSWSLSSVSVEAKTDDRLELATRDELRELITKYDRSGLQWTDQVIVENWTVPRSHPILTMNIRTTGDALLAAYLHEQLHWWIQTPPNAADSIDATRSIWPRVPDHSAGGALTPPHTDRPLVASRAASGLPCGLHPSFSCLLPVSILIMPGAHCGRDLDAPAVNQGLLSPEICSIRTPRRGSLLPMLVPKALLDRADYVPVTRSRLAGALTNLGVRRGGVLMVHVRMSSLGWMVGGMDAIIWALRDAVGPDGTLLAFTGWEDSPYHVSSWPVGWRQAYRDQPAFDPEVSAARREFGRFPERLRTWPGARRSSHPEVSFAAHGPTASQLLTEPSDDNPWGVEGPLGRLVAADGQVLMIGPIKTLTLCHHAEAIARVDGKRYHSYTMPVRVGDAVEWRQYRTLDTFFGTLPYWERDDLKITGWVATLMDQAIAAGASAQGTIDDCVLTLIDAPKATTAVTDWLEANF